MPARTFIAPERQPLIFLAVLAALLVHFLAGGWWALPAWLLVLVLLWLFREPSRAIPAAPLAVVSPADGDIAAVEPVKDPYLNREAVRISILMDLRSVFSTRSPIEGKVVQVWYKPGGALPPSHEAASQNQHIALWIKTDEGDDVVLVLFAAPLRRPTCYATTGTRLGQGQRCGFIPFGSRVDVLLPANVRVAVKPGERVLAGSSIIATLVHKR